MTSTDGASAVDGAGTSPGSEPGSGQASLIGAAPTGGGSGAVPPRVRLPLNLELAAVVVPATAPRRVRAAVGGVSSPLDDGIAPQVGAPVLVPLVPLTLPNRAPARASRLTSSLVRLSRALALESEVGTACTGVAIKRLPPDTRRLRADAQTHRLDNTVKPILTAPRSGTSNNADLLHAI
jgi:hypothetical protein